MELDTPATVTQNVKHGFINNQGQFTEDEDELYWITE
jgi:hypothetical protein